MVRVKQTLGVRLAGLLADVAAVDVAQGLDDVVAHRALGSQKQM